MRLTVCIDCSQIQGQDAGKLGMHGVSQQPLKPQTRLRGQILDMLWDQQQILKPQTTLRGALYMLRSFVNMQTSSIDLKLQTRLRGCAEPALLLANTAF